MTRVPVSPLVLRWARERSGKSVYQIAEKLPQAAKWETGEVQPTIRQLETYARTTFTPLGYLFLREPPDDRLPIPNFRTIADRTVGRPSANLLETVYSMLRRQNWMRDYLLDQGAEPMPQVGSFDESHDPGEVATSIRATLGLAGDWASKFHTWTDALDGLVATAEAVGILVMVNGVVGNDTHRKLDPDEFRGFVLVDEYAPLVFLNGVDYKASQMFTLAHELAHVWIGRSAAFDLRALQPASDAGEQACNRIAAEFLAPESEFRSLWASVGAVPRPFDTIARHFKVSTIVAARRALDLGLIDRDAFFAFYNAYREDERRRAAARSPGGDFYLVQDRRIGRSFGEAVVRAARQGTLLFRDAYDLTGLRGDTFDRFARRVERTSA